MYHLLLRARLTAALVLCLTGIVTGQNAAPPTDPEADKAVHALYENLRLLSGQGILFGHEDALAYGVDWREEDIDRSDVEAVCGAFPAVYGWDISKLERYKFNIDTVRFAHMRRLIRIAYRMGGINTISWHMDNPASGGTSWDTAAAVADIIPGGRLHEDYKATLDVVARYFKSMRSGFVFKQSIPIIFRPFHEHTGSWFWWGAGSCTAEDYVTLFRFTVDYLRKEKKLNNLLIAYSPDVFRDKAHYLERYPGDDYVDILGLDNYHDVSMYGDPTQLTRRLRMVVELADSLGKVAALTETGSDRIPRPDWWTQVLLQHIKADPTAARIAYLLVWRNARASHHFGPYPGHPSAPDFVDFANDPVTYFLSDLPDVYKMPRKGLKTSNTEDTE